MEQTTLTQNERQVIQPIIEETGIVLYLNRPFINSTGYKTLRTSRKSAMIPDSMVCLHTLIGWYKVYKNQQYTLKMSFAEVIKIAQRYKLETHHKDGNKTYNAITNIEPFLTRYQHNNLNYHLSLKGSE